MVVASCGWLKDNINNSNKNRNINDAIDIVRNTKILAFLLQNKAIIMVYSMHGLLLE